MLSVPCSNGNGSFTAPLNGFPASLGFMIVGSGREKLTYTHRISFEPCVYSVFSFCYNNSTATFFSQISRRTLCVLSEPVVFFLFFALLEVFFLLPCSSVMWWRAVVLWLLWWDCIIVHPTWVITSVKVLVCGGKTHGVKTRRLKNFNTYSSRRKITY